MDEHRARLEGRRLPLQHRRGEAAREHRALVRVEPARAARHQVGILQALHEVCGHRARALVECHRLRSIVDHACVRGRSDSTAQRRTASGRRVRAEAATALAGRAAGAAPAGGGGGRRATTGAGGIAGAADVRDAAGDQQERSRVRACRVHPRNHPTRTYRPNQATWQDLVRPIDVRSGPSTLLADRDSLRGSAMRRLHRRPAPGWSSWCRCAVAGSRAARTGCRRR